MSEFEKLRRQAFRVLMRTAKYPEAARQVGWLIDDAETITELFYALAMIGEFEVEEEFARFEARVNSPQGTPVVRPIQHRSPD